MRVLALGLSVVFHPLLLTTYLVALLGLFMPEFLRLPAGQLGTFVGLVALITFFLPGLNLVILKYFGNIPSLTMRERSERPGPFLMITLFYLAATVLFYLKLPFSMNFIRLLIIITSLITVATIITYFFKISIHSLAMAGAIGILLPLHQAAAGGLLIPTVGVLVAAGAVMSARLYLQVHSLREVGYGAGVGFGLGFLMMYILF